MSPPPVFQQPVVQERLPQPKPALSPLDRKILKAEAISHNWDSICKLAHEGDFESAYEFALSNKVDDLYFMRLMVQTGPFVLNSMSFELSRRVLKRINRLNRANWLVNQHVEWLDDGKKCGLLKKMSRGEQNEYLDTLYHTQTAECIQPALRERALEIYNGAKKQCMQI